MLTRQRERALLALRKAEDYIGEYHRLVDTDARTSLEVARNSYQNGEHAHEREPEQAAFFYDEAANHARDALSKARRDVDSARQSQSPGSSGVDWGNFLAGCRAAGAPAATAVGAAASPADRPEADRPSVEGGFLSNANAHFIARLARRAGPAAGVARKLPTKQNL